MALAWLTSRWLSPWENLALLPQQTLEKWPLPLQLAVIALLLQVIPGNLWLLAFSRQEAGTPFCAPEFQGTQIKCTQELSHRVLLQEQHGGIPLNFYGLASNKVGEMLFSLWWASHSFLGFLFLSLFLALHSASSWGREPHGTVMSSGQWHSLFFLPLITL